MDYLKVTETPIDTVICRRPENKTSFIIADKCFSSKYAKQSLVTKHAKWKNVIDRNMKEMIN